MTEEIAATPGWVEERLDELFAHRPPSAELSSARNAYLDCLAARKAPAAISDQLGAEFLDCRSTLLRALSTMGAATGDLPTQLEALEAEIDGNS